MKTKTTILSALILAAVGATFTAPVAVAAEQCEIDTRKTRVVSERVGRRVQKAYELYAEDNVDGALEILLEINPSGEFDKAYVSRMIGSLYAGKEGHIDTAMKHLKIAADINQLGGSDQAQTLRLLGDLNIAERNFDAALKYYNDWMAFTCKEDTNVYLRMASAKYEQKQYSDTLKYADKSIALQKEPNKGPYSLKMASYYETKQYKKAADVSEDIVRFFPNERRNWIQLGQMYMLGEDYKKALYTMDVAHRRGYLETASEYKMLAQLYAQNEIPFKSAALQEEYLKSGLVEKDESSLAMLANTYHQAKEIDKAITYYGQAAEIENNSRYFMRQAGLLMEKERYKEAKTAIRNAMNGKGLKSTGEAQMLLAQAHFYLGEYKSAHQAAVAASKDSKTKKSASGWISYIKETADRKDVAI
ncbi:tetratricopeptide repeat protein [Ferrimonas marina]|uniref:Tetratricopeptide repeat-containing protein n=1 Tax=Ferrimonas marina TaxID=299255 RepID=A0A1M5RND1_9GAMM|nr:hypothetical protein [Ferrimonas marina]SHH27671.1 Tetratricopeptide repeat-containing protein [Ferrimonas marina]